LNLKPRKATASSSRGTDAAPPTTADLGQKRMTRVTISPASMAMAETMPRTSKIS